MISTGESMVSRAHLVVTQNSERIIVTLTKPVTVIGRSREAELRIDDRSISAKHCEIVKLPAGYLLVDHGSRNGTVLRGQEVSEIFLRDGDEFVVGHASIRFVGPDPDEEKMRQATPSPAVAEMAPSPLPTAAAVPAPSGAPAGTGSPDKSDDTREVPRLRRRRRVARSSGIPVPVFVIGLVLAAAGAAALCWAFLGGQEITSGRAGGSGEPPKSVAANSAQPLVGGEVERRPEKAPRGEGRAFGEGASAKSRTSELDPDPGPAPSRHEPGGAADQEIGGSAPAGPARSREPLKEKRPVAVSQDNPEDAVEGALGIVGGETRSRETLLEGESPRGPGPGSGSADPPSREPGAQGTGGGEGNGSKGGNDGPEGDPGLRGTQGEETKAAGDPVEDGPAHEWEYEFMGVSGRGTHVCFVLDASASMSFPTQQGGKVKRDIMKKHLVDAIEDLEPETSFTIVFFTSEAYAMTGKFVKATAANKSEATAWIDAFERRGATNLWSGLQRAFEIVKKVPGNERKAKGFRVAMFVLSDGRVRDAQSILRGAEALVGSAPVTIHTLSFDQEDRVLEDLAKIGGGEYQVVK